MGSLAPMQGLGALFSILSTPASAAQQQMQYVVMSVDWSIIIKQVLFTVETSLCRGTHTGVLRMAAAHCHLYKAGASKAI